ncbi:hypothetical protein GT037_008079 [Alternaria burnsii]|uniref:Uncharacterized protein n=1 Tax=Alternaria burnsii TaxID=1187904 RepID=A0A8H7B3J3_9PLEO|nr:uncharacterized protein GT037_008079 [Alternaria burnsii]KAF7674313.1 hypothetical protein GT037_008079 [Alternaria burnsii]
MVSAKASWLSRCGRTSHALTFVTLTSLWKNASQADASRIHFGMIRKGYAAETLRERREKGYDAETLESRGEKGDVGYFGIWHHPAFAPRGRY